MFNIGDKVKFYVKGLDVIKSNRINDFDLNTLSIIKGTIIICNKSFSDNLILLENDIESMDMYHLHEDDIDFYQKHTSYDVSDYLSDYLNKKVYWVMTEYLLSDIIKEEEKITGSSCTSCGQFSYMSIPNQPDKTFKCYSCRSNPIRMYL